MNTTLILLISLIGLMLGIMLFFAAVVTRKAFASLSSENAGPFLRAIFPVYYLWGMVIGVLMAGLAFFSDQVLFVITSVIAILFIVTRQWLLPAINQAREARLAEVQGADKRFKYLHLFSVVINLIQMLLLMGALGWLVWSH